MKATTFKYECPNCEHEITFTYMPATPDVFYLRNGDPGYPGDPAEVDGPETCPSCGEELALDDVLQEGHDIVSAMDADVPEREDD